MGFTLAEIINELSDPYVLVLYRENLLEQYVSWKIADKNKVWWSTHSNPDTTVPVTLSALDKFIQEEKQQWAEAMKHIIKSKTMFVKYENLRDDKYTELNRILKFFKLGRTDRVFLDMITQQNPQKIENKVSNYEEIKRHILQNTDKYTLNLQ
ncbi:unnamed protein product [Owenia fusiformis]|uniref:Uncharacterized protein n=1 Tax=Owenia fusiformis TaxID=6347 RepID=A0A8J1TS64_OWEFU|nr:unnamed protein product [Owenia fusiformis]